MVNKVLRQKPVAALPWRLKMAQLRAHPNAAPVLLQVHSTTGRPLTIRYDAATNAVAFEENDWHADGFRLGHEPQQAPRRTPPRQRLTLRRRAV